MKKFREKIKSDGARNEEKTSMKREGSNLSKAKNTISKRLIKY